MKTIIAIASILLAGCSALNVSGGLTITYNQDAATLTKSVHVQQKGDVREEKK